MRSTAELEAFVAVARTGSVGRAAERIGRTQPSISARLASLEQAWDTRLFRRVARGMTLTPEGSRLLPLAETTLRQLERLELAAGLPVNGAHELRVGAGDALGREVLPRALAALVAERPGIEVRLLEGPGPRLVDALRNGEIDVAFVVRPVGETPPDGADVRTVLRSAVEVLAPAGGTGRRRSLGLPALARERLVTLQPGSAFRRHLEAAFADADLRFRPAVEVGNLSLVRRFVAAGLGLAPVPSVAFPAGEDPVGVERLRLSGVAPLTYVALTRAGVPPAPGTLRLLERVAGAP